MHLTCVTRDMLAGNQRAQFPSQIVDTDRNTQLPLGTHVTKQATPNDATHRRTLQPSLLEMDYPLAPSSKDPISGALPK